MDKNTFHIKEITELTNLEKSTIRYWERAGLLHLKRDRQNNYRVFDSRSLIELMDIIFYRSLNIPVKKLKRILHQKPETTYQALNDSEAELARELEKIQRKQAVIQRKKQNLEELFQLQTKDLQISFPINFNYIEPFNFSHITHVSQYSTSPSNFILFFQNGDPDEYHEGIVVDEKLSANLIFEKKEQKIWFGGLLEVNNSDYTKNNLVSLQQRLKLSKDTPCIAQYIASGKSTTGSMIDYYKCWFILD
ncbi:transcriptional regulator, MerR family [Enterococcus faecalis 13-SD-W-01]|nr:transcriptional regulator, MerR family [Enterococcus faecalis 13-SD-W-01]